MLSLLLSGAPRGFGRERASTALLLFCMVAAIALRLMLCAQERLAADRAFRLPDGSRILLVDPDKSARARAAGRSGPATTRVRLEDATVHGGSPSNERIAFVDPTFSDVFRVASCRGSVGHALARGDEVVLTASTARRLFGDADPVGRSLVMSVGDEALALRVGAVACDQPAFPQLTYSMLATLEPFLLLQGADDGRADGRAGDIPTYLRVPASATGGASALAAMDGRAMGGDAASASALTPDGAAPPSPTGAARRASRVVFLVVLLQALGWSLARLVPRAREAALYRRSNATPTRSAAMLLLDPVLLVPAAGLLAVGVTESLFGGTLPYGGSQGVLATLAGSCAALLCAFAVAPLVVALGGAPRPVRNGHVRRPGERMPTLARAAVLVFQLGLVMALISAGAAFLAPWSGLGGGRGHDPARLLMVASLADPAINAAQRQSLLRSLSRVEGVEAVGAATRLFGPDLPRATIARGGLRVGAPFAVVDPGALSALRLRPLAGQPTTPGIVLTAGTARRLGFATPASAVGISLGGDHPGVVRAVVHDLRFGPDGTRAAAGLFVVAPTAPPTAVAVIRTTGAPIPSPAMRAAWRTTAPDVPLDAVALRDVERSSWSDQRDTAGPLAVAAAVAILAAFAGLWNLITDVADRLTRTSADFRKTPAPTGRLVGRVAAIVGPIVLLGAASAAILLTLPAAHDGGDARTPLLAIAVVVALAAGGLTLRVVAPVANRVARSR